jgi:hypothetical protein
MPIKRKKLDADVPEPPRWQKMMAGATDMEILLFDCMEYLQGSREQFGSEDSLIERIKRQLKLSGRLP